MKTAPKQFYSVNSSSKSTCMTRIKLLHTVLFPYHYMLHKRLLHNHTLCKVTSSTSVPYTNLSLQFYPQLVQEENARPHPTCSIYQQTQSAEVHPGSAVQAAAELDNSLWTACLATDCCVYFGVRACIIHGLHVGNSVLPKSVSLSFEYNNGISHCTNKKSF